MSERRFTDDEVARILKRATELDRREGSSHAVDVARGLSLAELQEVAQEVGIAPQTVARAVLDLDKPGPSGLGEMVLGGSPVAQRTHLIERPLTQDELARLVQVIDEVVPAQGSVTEALGSVRWNGQGRFLSRQVVLQPTESDTRVRVQERYEGRTRLISHLLPMTYGLGIGLAVGADVLGGAGTTLALTALGGAGGFGIGRAIWAGLKAASLRRVRKVSDAIAKAAGELTATPR